MTRPDALRLIGAGFAKADPDTGQREIAPSSGQTRQRGHHAPRAEGGVSSAAASASTSHRSRPARGAIACAGSTSG